MTPNELFQAGKLDEAISALGEAIKSAPGDLGQRTFLFELLCFAGNLDRAEKQLEAIGKLNQEAEWPAQIYTNILAAERLRRRVLTDGNAPEFFIEPPHHIRERLEAIKLLRNGQSTDAADRLAHADEETPNLTGLVDGQPFDGFRDCDDLLAPVLEVILLRDYIWVPWEQVREIEFTPPTRLRDVMWLPGKMTMIDGQSRRAFFPSMYVGSDATSDAEVRVGRATIWDELPGGIVRGLGARILLAGDEGKSMIHIRQIEFASS